jgi:hypothetical protein
LWEHQCQWAAATALLVSSCIWCVLRGLLYPPGEPPTRMRRLRIACDSGTIYIRTPTE